MYKYSKLSKIENTAKYISCSIYYILQVYNMLML